MGAPDHLGDLEGVLDRLGVCGEERIDLCPDSRKQHALYQRKARLKILDTLLCRESRFSGVYFGSHSANSQALSAKEPLTKLNDDFGLRNGFTLTISFLPVESRK